MDDLALESRQGLPDALRVLRETLPRDGWEGHENFDGLTRFWMERHLMFREVLRRLRDGTEAFIDMRTPPETYLRETSRYAGYLFNQLHGHHQIEDAHYFPMLKDVDQRLAPGFEILDRDHHALDGHIHRAVEATNGLLKSEPAGWTDRAGALDSVFSRFDGFLDRHLEDEEDLIVPIILTYGITAG